MLFQAPEGNCHKSDELCSVSILEGQQSLPAVLGTAVLALPGLAQAELQGQGFLLCFSIGGTFSSPNSSRRNPWVFMGDTCGVCRAAAHGFFPQSPAVGG